MVTVNTYYRYLMMNRKSIIPVTKPVLPDREKFDRYIDRIFESGWLTNRGELVRELESRLENYLGVRNVVLVANGTLALQVAYRALGIHGEVITTPFSFVASASSIVWEGNTIKFADIDPDTLNINPDEIERVITPQTQAIVPVHVYGNPCDVERIHAIANANNLRIVYDASHAFGVKSVKGSVLNWGDISTLSFHATKLFHTVEGGALIIKDDEVCERAREIINFGFSSAGDINRLGINAKMSEIHAATGLCILDDIDEVIKGRRLVTECYDKDLRDIPLDRPLWNSAFSKNYHYYPVIFRNEDELLDVVDRLKEHDVKPRRYFLPSLDTLGFLSPGMAARVSKKLAVQILCLPIYSVMRPEDIGKVVQVIQKSFR